MDKLSEENVKRYMWPHLHIQKGNQRSAAVDLIQHNHGDIITIKVGKKKVKATFRLIEEDLYEDEFYQYALPICKKIWKIKQGEE